MNFVGDKLTKLAFNGSRACKMLVEAGMQQSLPKVIMITQDVICWFFLTTKYVDVMYIIGQCVCQVNLYCKLVTNGSSSG